MIITEIQLKNTHRPVVFTKSLIPSVNHAPSGWVYLSHLITPSSLLLALLLSPWLPCSNFRKPNSAVSGPLHKLFFTAWRILPMAPGRLTHAHPWGLSFIGSLSGRLCRTPRPKQVSSESHYQSILLFPFIVHHTIWNVQFICLHVFLLSWLDCKLLKSKDHMCLNSPLQPHCSAQGLTHIQMCRDNNEGVKCFWKI